MTRRSILLGLLGAAAICSLTYLNDSVLRQTYLVGNSLPISVFGTLVIFCLVNAAIFRLSRKLALSGAELATIVGLTLAACCVPSSGLLRTFIPNIIMPHHWQKTKPGWRENHLIDEVVDERMLADITREVGRGKLQAVDDQAAVLQNPDGVVKEDLVGSLLKVYPADTRVQARRIIGVDPTTGRVELGEAWAETPAVGSRYRILASNDDAVLGTYLQGRSRTGNRTFRTAARLKCVAVTDDTITFGPDAAGVDGTYTGALIVEDGADEQTQNRITAYDGQTRTARLAEPWAAPPEPRSVMSLSRPGAPPWRQDILTGVVQAATAATVTLGPMASDSTDAFCDLEIRITSGNAAGDAGRIVDYNGSTKVAAVAAPWAVVPQPGDQYEIVLDVPPLPLTGKGSPVAADQVELQDNASQREHAYTGMELEILDGPAAGQRRTVKSYSGRTRLAAVDRPWEPAPGAEFTYRIHQKTTVPWSAWRRALGFWLPLIVGIWIALIGLMLVLHPQWARHEHLPYPIAQFANSLLPDEGKPISPIFHNRMFWVAAAVIAAIHLNNYIVTWHPQAWIRIPTNIELGPLVNLVEHLKRAWWLKRGLIYFSVVAFGYFLSTEVSFSVGIGPIVFAFVWSVLGKYGIDLQGGGEAPVLPAFSFGAYVGFAAILFYTGRHYYLAVTRKALFIPCNEKLPASSVWGARTFGLGLLLFMTMLVLPPAWGGVGLDWQLALLFGLGTCLLFAVMARIIAETGFFFIQTNWGPAVILIGVLGIRNLGPETIFILLMVNLVLMIDPRESLMPFLANGLRLMELRRHKLGRSAGWCTAALLIGLLIAVPLTIQLHYRLGAPLADKWATKSSLMRTFSRTNNSISKLAGRDQLAESRQISGFQRFFNMGLPRSTTLVGFAVGLALVLLFSLGRLRFTKWPLHPVMFLICATYSAYMFAFSFLIGCLIKTVVMKFGGAKVYQDLRPLFYGMIAGELGIGMITIVFGFLYFLATGDSPRAFRIFPG